MCEVEKRLKSTNFDKKMAAKSPKAPKSKIRKKRPGVLGHVVCCPTFGTIRARSSEIRLVTDRQTDRQTDRRRTTTDGNRLSDHRSVNPKTRFNENTMYYI